MAAHRQTELENQIRLWIKQNKKESSRLEFKWQIDVGTPDDKAEFIRDVMALANSEGEYPRKEGYLVVGVRNGKCHDIQNEHYDGARFGQILDAYIYPSVDVSYEEFGNKSRGRIGVLIVKPDSDFLYVVSKALQVGKGQPLLSPGQSWGRKSDRKALLTGQEIHARLRDIQNRKIEGATAPLQARIDKLEREGGAAFEVKRIRFDMETNAGWDAIEGYLQKLFPYAREFDNVVKHEVLNAVSDVTARTKLGMPPDVARSLETVLSELMPMRGGGLLYPDRQGISKDEQELLARIEQATFELTWDACRYLRDIKVVEVAARLYWMLIRHATLNSLKHFQSECLNNARRCQHTCTEERKGKTFPEAHTQLEEAIADALDAFRDDYLVKKISPSELTGPVLSACVAIIRKGQAVDLQSANRELPLATSVAIAYKGSQIVGVGAIKRERREYVAKVSTQSGVDVPPETLELGYIAVDPDHQGRGLSHRVTSLLVAQYKGRLFATTYNDRMKRTLEKEGFVKKGKEWKGRKFTLSFWDKE